MAWFSKTYPFKMHRSTGINQGATTGPHRQHDNSVWMSLQRHLHSKVKTAHRPWDKTDSPSTGIPLVSAKGKSIAWALCFIKLKLTNIQWHSFIQTGQVIKNAQIFMALSLKILFILPLMRPPRIKTISLGWSLSGVTLFTYHQISNIRCTKSQNVNVSRLIL